MGAQIPGSGFDASYSRAVRRTFKDFLKVLFVTCDAVGGGWAEI
jgi:hypothetical protein